MPASTPAPAKVQNPLNLLLTIKPGQAPTLIKLLSENEAAINAALTKVGTVHFARFLFLNENTLLVITTYDGDFNTYIEQFTNILGNVFDAIFGLTNPAPPLPVQNNVQAFIDFVQKWNLKSNLYSAYPQCTVQQILSLDCAQGQ
jgi:hypothetical protein